MAGSLQARVKTWVSLEDVEYDDLNAEFDNVLLAMQPLLIDDYSTNVAQMQVTADPGEVDTESLATTLAGELARLRYAIKEIKGDVAQWYSSSSFSLSSFGAAVGGGLSNNRLSSGRSRSADGSSQAIALVPHGAARTITLKGATTDFVYYIAGVQYTIDADVTITSLGAAPGTNNTCLVNDAGIDDGEHTKYIGEFGSTLTVDAMGAEISSLIGKIAAFKLNNGAADEYFMARVVSATELVDIRRGAFFDSADAPIPRIAFADNDTITLMRLAWIFAKTDETLTVSYGNPQVGKDEPTGAATGDYWFDTDNDIWKVFNATTWDSAGATLVGVCMTDTTNTVAARSFDYFKSEDETNTLAVEYFDATEVRSVKRNEIVTVYGSSVRYQPDYIRWDIDTDLDTGTEAADTLYFLYITEDGDSLLSVTGPTYMAERGGLYHPSHTWRCFGSVYNNASSNFENVISYYDVSEQNYSVSHKVASSALTLQIHANPITRFKVKNTTGANGESLYSTILPGTKLVVSSGSKLGTVDATAATLILHGITFAGRMELGISQAPHLDGHLGSSTAEGGAGAADAGEILYSTVARTSAPIKILLKAVSTQATAGTWATALTELHKFPFKYTYAQVFNASGSSVVPSGHTMLHCLGAGGGGGGGGFGTDGAGGGGGGIIFEVEQVVAPEVTLTVTVGASGAGGVGSGAVGTSGGDTTITGTGVSLFFGGGGGGGSNSAGLDSVLALGGIVGTNTGGGGASSGNGGAGGVTTTSNSGKTGYNGGGGGGSGNSGGGTGGSGGKSYYFGGTAAAGGSGNNAGGGGGSSYGIGGAGGTAGGSSAAANTGGGGGGAGASGNGGAGGSGKVIIYWKV